MGYQNKDFQDKDQKKEPPIIPTPLSIRYKLNSSQCNFGLFSPRMVSWELNKKGELKSDESYMQKLYNKSKQVYPGLNRLIEKKHVQQNNYLKTLKGVQVFSIPAKLSSPFITGLGSGHPTEIGMILDRNLGIPYIPASSVKGVLRLACAINIARKNGSNEVNLEDETLVKYFGSESDRKPQRGQLVILDVYPKTITGLKLDIMNPHNPKYYSGKIKHPVETETLNPKKFLTVPKGTEFVFNIAFIPLKKEDKCDEAELKKIINTAFETVGFGGKTSIGYGRFREI